MTTRGARPGLRITGGTARGRTLLTLEGDAIRPTADRTRKAIFDLLEGGRFSRDGGSPLVDARVVDVCCGTGALGLEALSRGARHAVLLDQSPEARGLARANAERLGLADRVSVIAGDAATPPPASDACALLFADPPYASGLVSILPAAFARAGWLGPEALLALEVPVGTSAETPEGFMLLEDRRYGRARVRLLRARGDSDTRQG